MIRILKYLSYILYISLILFICRIVFGSTTGHCDKSADGLGLLMFIAIEVVCFFVVILIHAIFNKHNLKMFYIVSTFPIAMSYIAIIYRFFLCDKENQLYSLCFLIPTILLIPYFFSSNSKLKYLSSIVIGIVILVLGITIPSAASTILVLSLCFSIPLLATTRLIFTNKAKILKK